MAIAHKYIHCIIISFIKQTLKEREQFGIPPFGYMTSLIFSGSSKSLIEKYTSDLVRASKKEKNIDVLGPTEAQRFLLRGKYRFRILLKGNNRKNLNKFTRKMLDLCKKPPSVKVIIDVDPYSFM